VELGAEVSAGATVVSDPVPQADATTRASAQARIFTGPDWHAGLEGSGHDLYTACAYLIRGRQRRRPPPQGGDQWGDLHACSNGYMGFFDKFRQPKTPHLHNSPTRLLPSCPPPGETWPWPDIDRPTVQLLQEKVAFHEAGHAVIARCFGIKVIQLSLRRRVG
ncbi:uncharacterized protein METZ01_LOCUS346263, partial [marine metagenome]